MPWVTFPSLITKLYLKLYIQNWIKVYILQSTYTNIRKDCNYANDKYIYNTTLKFIEIQACPGNLRTTLVHYTVDITEKDIAIEYLHTG
jgi:hypothetical protein